MGDVIEVVEPHVVLANRGALGAFYSLVPPGMPYVLRAKELNLDRQQRYTHGAFLQIADMTSGAKPSVTSDVRAGMIENMRQSDHYHLVTAVVFLGGGFAAAAVRAIGTGMVAVAGLKGEIRFYSSLDDAVSRLLEFSPKLAGNLPSRASIDELVREMKAKAA